MHHSAAKEHRGTPDSQPFVGLVWGKSFYNTRERKEHGRGTAEAHKLPLFPTEKKKVWHFIVHELGDPLCT